MLPGRLVFADNAFYRDGDYGYQDYLRYFHYHCAGLYSVASTCEKADYLHRGGVKQPGVMEYSGVWGDGDINLPAAPNSLDYAG